MITIKNFRLTESSDESENQDYQLKYSVFNRILETLGYLYSDKNTNLIKDSSTGTVSITKNDALMLVTELLQLLDNNFDIHAKTALTSSGIVDDWRGFIALTSIKATYADLIKIDKVDDSSNSNENVTYNDSAYEDLSDVDTDNSQIINEEVDNYDANS